MPSLRRLRSKSRLPEDQPTYSAAVAALLYVAVAIFYILVSGRVAAVFAGSLEQLQMIETYKGLVFVVVTGILFFFISLDWWRRTARQRDLLVESERRAVASLYSAALAHDLNNLLMGLSGLVEAIKGHEKDDPVLTLMRQSVEQTIRSLAPFAKRIAATARNLPAGESVPADLPSALNQIAELAKRHADVKFCTLTVADIPPIAITLNADLMEQAVLNLIVNAAHAAGPKGAIKLAAERRNNAVAIEVHDSGPGVPPEKVEAIFRPGFTTKRTGSGLGLLSVQAFAASCNAQITVERSPLGGALFRLLIPLSPEPSQTAP